MFVEWGWKMNELELLAAIRKYLQHVHEMRESQKVYFRTRSKDALIRSREYEKFIDEKHAEIAQNAYDLWFFANEHQKQIDELLWMESN